MQHCLSRNVSRCILKTNNVTNTGFLSTRNRINGININYTQRRHNALWNWLTNKLSIGYKIRGVKSREDFKPKGILVYKSTYLRAFKFLAIGSGFFAAAFTFMGIYDYIYPIDFFVQNYLVMFVGGISAWMIPLFILPSFGRRFVTRMWLENNWWIHIESHSRFGSLRYTRVNFKYLSIFSGKF